MPESFLAALRVVLPMALLIMLGVGVRKAGIMDRTVMRNVDKLTFRVFMPVLLFKNIYETDLSQSVAPEEAVFAALSLVLVIFPTALLLPPRLVKSRAQAASIGQAMIRSNYILFGIAVAESIFGEGNVGPVALLGAIVVPLTNALSVIVLEMGRSGRAEPKRLALSILKNPMVVAALAAIAASALPFRMPELLWGVVKDVAGVTTTISFISLGVGLNLGQARANRRPLFLGLALRMVLIPLIFLPLSVALGFRNHTVDFYNVLLYLSLPQFRDAVNGKTRKKCQTGGTIQALLSVCLSKGPALKIQKAAPCGRYSSNLPVKR